LNKLDRVNFIKGYFISAVFSLFERIPKIRSQIMKIIVLFTTAKYNLITPLNRKHTEYEHHFKVENGDYVIDVGAGIGAFTLSVVNRASFIVAIEPAPNNIHKLHKNTKKLKNIMIIEKAVSSVRGRATLHLALSPVAHSLYIDANERYKYGSCVVEMDTLDNIVSSLEIEEIDFMKINVEGAEIEVLEGGKETIKKTKKMVICADHMRNGKRTVSYIKSFLELLGFSVIINSQYMVYAIKHENPYPPIMKL